MDFQDKVVMISGAASGFGRLAAQRFAELGARLAVCDINTDGLESTVAALDLPTDRIIANSVDVTSPEQVDSFFSAIDSGFSRLDIAVNNAGIAHEHTLLADCDEALWEKMIAVNLTGVFTFLRRELTRMSKVQTGVILNVASVAGVLGAPMLGPYGASKHGVVGLTRTAAAEYGPLGIRVNALCPGYSPTPMVTAMIDAGDADLPSKMTGRIPLGRMAEPEEVVNAMLWLCSPQNSFMNGAAVVLDGGLTAC